MARATPARWPLPAMASLLVLVVALDDALGVLVPPPAAAKPFAALVPCCGRICLGHRQQLLPEVGIAHVGYMTVTCDGYM